MTLVCVGKVIVEVIWVIPDATVTGGGVMVFVVVVNVL